MRIALLLLTALIAQAAEPAIVQEDQDALTRIYIAIASKMQAASNDQVNVANAQKRAEQSQKELAEANALASKSIQELQKKYKVADVCQPTTQDANAVWVFKCPAVPAPK